MEKKLDKLKETTLFGFVSRNMPFILTFLAIIAEIAPVHFSYFSFVRPKISLIFIFLTSVYFPANTGNFRIFFLGLFSDFLRFSLLGLNAFLFLTTYVVVSKYSNYLANRSFSFVYVVFIAASLVAFLIEMLIVIVWQHAFPSITQTLVSCLLTVAVYPFIVKIFYLLEKNSDGV